MKIPKQTHARYLAIAVVGAIVQLAIFKYFYPTADYTFNSHNYINAVLQKTGFCLWPIGYSLFLEFIHTITHTDYVVVICQYALLQAGASALFTTINRFYALPLHIKNTMFVTLAFNPISLYISNYIMPEALFTAVSLFWLANLLFIIHKPTVLNSTTHAILLFALPILKIHGLFYPVVSIITISSIHQPLKQKVLPLCVSIFATLLTLVITTQIARIETGRYQLPAIASWQIANNALYGYQPTGGFDRPLPPETTELNTRMLRHFTANPAHFTPRDGSMYIHGFTSPLRQYWLEYVLKDPAITEEKAWSALAPTVSTWGVHVVREHPGAYLRYYIVPNILNYLLPLTREISAYNFGSAEVNLVIKDWFDYSSVTVTSRLPTLQGKIFLLYAAMFFVTNLVIIIGSIFFFIKKYTPYVETPTLKQLTTLAISFYVMNLCFCVIFQPVDLFSVLFPTILYPSFILLALSIFTRPEPLPTSSNLA